MLIKYKRDINLQLLVDMLLTIGGGKSVVAAAGGSNGVVC